MKKKKVLVISNSYPLPEKTGSRQRTMHFVRYFKQFAEVDLVYSVSEDVEIREQEEFRRVICIPYLWQASGWYRNSLFFFRRLPWCILSKYSPAFKKELLDLIRAEGYDVIFIRYLLHGQYFFSAPRFLREKVCLDVDDVWSGSLYRELHAVVTRHALKKRLDFTNLVRYEKRCCEKLGAVLFSGRDDLNRVAGEDRKNCHVVPNVVRRSDGKQSGAAGDGVRNHRILFVGSLNYQPNSEGVCWFADNIFPECKRAVPEATLLIVGRRPPEEVVRLADRDGIEVHADVPDVEQYYTMSDVVVVPILQGGGTRIKILEAALMKRPVLSTEKGAEGIDFSEGREILIFRDAQSFLEQYQRLLDPEFYRTMAADSCRKVEAQYSEKFFTETMDEILFNRKKVES